MTVRYEAKLTWRGRLLLAALRNGWVRKLVGKKIENYVKELWDGLRAGSVKKQGGLG
jgi:hypothetical protein